MRAALSGKGNESSDRAHDLVEEIRSEPLNLLLVPGGREEQLDSRFVEELDDQRSERSRA